MLPERSTVAQTTRGGITELGEQRLEGRPRARVSSFYGTPIQIMESTTTDHFSIAPWERQAINGRTRVLNSATISYSSGCVAQDGFQFKEFLKPSLAPFTAVARLFVASKTTGKIHSRAVDVYVA